MQRLAAQSPTTADGATPPWEAADIAQDSGENQRVTKGLSRRRVLVGAGLAVVAVGGAGLLATQVIGTSTAVAATPPLLAFQPVAQQTDARSLLGDLSVRAAGQPAPPGRGPVFYSQSRSWSFTAVQGTGGEDLGSLLAERLSEVWVRPDGTGRGVSREQNLPPGATPMTDDRPFDKTPWPDTLTDHGGLVDWFTRAGQQHDAAWFLTEAVHTWPVWLNKPAVTSAFLEVLSTRPGLAVEGRTTDRAGRPAIAVSAVLTDSGSFPTQRAYLLIDPETGVLRAVEYVALSVDTAQLHTTVRTPATVRYHLWLASAFVADTSSRP